MEVRIKQGEEMIDATIEMVDGVMVVSPKEVKFEPKEVKFEPKDGDVCKSISCIYIFKGVRPSDVSKDESAIVYHCCYNGDYLTVEENVGVGYISRNQRYATEEEKRKLFDKLAEEGFEWKSDTKELVKIKWKPKEGEKFYFPIFSDDLGEFVIDYQENDGTIFMSIERDWCFKTSKECQDFCNRLNEAINSVKP